MRAFLCAPGLCLDASGNQCVLTGSQCVLRASVPPCVVAFCGFVLYAYTGPVPYKSYTSARISFLLCGELAVRWLGCEKAASMQARTDACMHTYTQSCKHTTAPRATPQHTSTHISKPAALLGVSWLSLAQPNAPPTEHPPNRTAKRTAKCELLLATNESESTGRADSWGGGCGPPQLQGAGVVVYDCAVLSPSVFHGSSSLVGGWASSDPWRGNSDYFCN